MNNWEKLDIYDVLKEQLVELHAKAIALAEVGRLTESDAVDDRIIVIEDYISSK